MPAIGCEPSAGAAKDVARLTRVDDRDLMQTLHTAGRPYVLLSFYTTCCKPCVKEIQALQAINQKAESPLAVVFISLDEGEASASLPAFLARHGLAHSYHLDGQAASAFFGATAPEWNERVPQNLLFTQEGRLVEHLRITDAKEVMMLVHEDQSFH